MATGDMTTDFARRQRASRVHIRISRASTNGTHEFVKVPCCEPLSGLRQHLVWFNASFHCALVRTRTGGR